MTDSTPKRPGAIVGSFPLEYTAALVAAATLRLRMLAPQVEPTDKDIKGLLAAWAWDGMHKQAEQDLLAMSGG